MGGPRVQGADSYGTCVLKVGYTVAPTAPSQEGSDYLAACAHDLRAICSCVGSAHEAIASIEAGADRPDDDPVSLTALAQLLQDLEVSLGRPLLVMDQFEEVLGEPRFRHEALSLIEAVFREYTSTVQLVSMREDNSGLLAPLQRGAIDNWSERSLDFGPLTSGALEQVVLDVCRTLPDWTIAPEALGLMIRSIPSSASVSLVANAALHYLYRSTRDRKEATEEDVRRLLKKVQAYAGDPTRPLDGILRLWIEECLEGRLSGDDAGGCVPFPGARPYTDGLEQYFRGREVEERRLTARLDKQRLVLLLAASASGKTSFLNASVVPVLRRRRLDSVASHVAGESTRPRVFPVVMNRWDMRVDPRFGRNYYWVLAKGILAALLDSLKWTVARLDEARGNTASSLSEDITAALQEAHKCLDECNDSRNVRERAWNPSTFSDMSEAGIVPASKTMAARMASRLVSYSNHKRAVDADELADVTYRQDLGMAARQPSVDASLVRPAGSALALLSGEQGKPATRETPVSIGAKADPRLASLLDGVFLRTLSRLQAGSVLKRSGTTYELVHDGFCEPLRKWSDEWLKLPESRFDMLTSSTGAYIALGDVQEWATERAYAPLVQHAVWRDCMIAAVDFRGVSFHGCDFTGSTFLNCKFGSLPDCGEPVLISKCVFEGVSMTDCEFHSAIKNKRNSLALEDCVMNRSRWIGCQFTGVCLSDVRLRKSEFSRCTFSDFSVAGAEDSRLDMSSSLFVGGSVRGTFRFTKVDLTGSGFAGLDCTEATETGFEDCMLKAVRFEGLRLGVVTQFSIQGASASVDADGRPRWSSDLAGAYFKDMDLGGTKGCSFTNTPLDGAMFESCSLRTMRVSSDPAGPGAVPVAAESLLILRCTVGGLVFDNVRCNGIVLQDVAVEATCEFKRCELWRPEFESLKFQDGASVVLTTSRVYYARIQPSDIRAGLVMTPEQERDNPPVEEALVQAKSLMLE